MKTKTFDPKCYDLAVHFLEDGEKYPDEKRRASLAAAIQEAIEDWVDEDERTRERAA